MLYIILTELMNAKKLFNEYNPKLVRFLPLKDPYFIAELTKQNLFSGNLKQEVMMTTITQADASANFLYKAIESALDIGNKEPFNRLLQVMEKFDDLTLNQLATEIKQEMTGGGDMKLESAIDDSGVPHMNISG